MLTKEQIKEKVSSLTDREVQDEMLMLISQMNKRIEVTNIRLAWLVFFLALPYAAGILYFFMK